MLNKDEKYKIWVESAEPIHIQVNQKRKWTWLDWLGVLAVVEIAVLLLLLFS